MMSDDVYDYDFYFSELEIYANKKRDKNSSIRIAIPILFIMLPLFIKGNNFLDFVQAIMLISAVVLTPFMFYGVYGIKKNFNTFIEESIDKKEFNMLAQLIDSRKRLSKGAKLYISSTISTVIVICIAYIVWYKEVVFLWIPFNYLASISILYFGLAAISIYNTLLSNVKLELKNSLRELDTTIEVFVERVKEWSVLA